jgi:uncharacterized protein YkwD
MRKHFAAIGIAGVLFLLSMSPALSMDSSAQRTLFAALNRERKEQGLPALKWNEALASAAQAHAVEMARHNLVSHTLPGEPSLASRATKAGAHFGWISENVVQSLSAEGAHEQFIQSPNHRANILDSDMDSVGVGVAERHGQLFVVEDFAKIK